MPFEWPQFEQKIPIDAARSWTATFESFDERKLDLYYIVTLHEGNKKVTRFFVCVFLWWAEENWSDPGFADHLQKAIHAVAATGRTNTDYTGSLAGWMAAGGRSPLD